MLHGIQFLTLISGASKNRCFCFENMLLADIPNQIWNLGPSTCFFVNLRVLKHFVSTQQSVPTENTNIPIGSMHGIHLPTFIVGFL